MTGDSSLDAISIFPLLIVFCVFLCQLVEFLCRIFKIEWGFWFCFLIIYYSSGSFLSCQLLLDKCIHCSCKFVIFLIGKRCADESTGNRIRFGFRVFFLFCSNVHFFVYYCVHGHHCFVLDHVPCLCCRNNICFFFFCLM